MTLKPRLLVCSLAVLAVATSAGLASQHEIKPGVERWPIKTSVPAGANLSHGASVSYADLAKLDDPPGAVMSGRPKASTSSATTWSSPPSALLNSIGTNSGLFGVSAILACRHDSSADTFSP